MLSLKATSISNPLRSIPHRGRQRLCVQRVYTHPVHSFTHRCHGRHRPGIGVPSAVLTPFQRSSSPEEQEELSYIDQLQEEHGAEGFVDFVEGENGLPMAILQHPSGYNVEVYLHGACVTRWTKPDGNEMLFLDPNQDYDPDGSIRGGVSLTFPCWRVHPTLMENGFADKLPWDVIDAGLATSFTDAVAFCPEGEQQKVVMQGIQRLCELYEDRSTLLWGSTLKAMAGETEEGEDPKEVEEELELLLNELISEAQAQAQEGEEMEEAGEDAAQQDQDERPEAALEGEDLQEGAGEEEKEGQLDEEEAAEALDYDSATGLPISLLADIDHKVDNLEMGDPAPYVTMRLTDNEWTRQLWPHSFELIYRVTLSEADDFEDPRVQMKSIPGQDLSDVDPDWMMMKGLDGTEMAEAEEGEQEDGPKMAQMRGYDVTAEEDKDPGWVFDEEKVPMQLKLQFILRNTDAPGSEPMQFQLGTLAHFATQDLLSHRSDFVRSLGLGGLMVFDYSEDPRVGKLGHFTEDYLQFGEHRVDTLFVNAKESDVKFCPGNRSHFEFSMRKGFKDVMVYQPGAVNLPGLEFSRLFVTMGAGKVAVPSGLAPGEEFHAEQVIRFQDKYWEQPIFDRKGLQPMPNIDLSSGPSEDQMASLADEEQMPESGEQDNDFVT